MRSREELEGPGDSLDVRALVQGLARSTRWILACVLLGTLVGLGVGLARPNVYVSEGKVEVRLGIRERRTPENSLDPTNEAPAPLPGIGDEIELLTNPEVFARVAAKIGPEKLLAPYDPAASDGPEADLPRRWLHAAQSWWFRRLASAHDPAEVERDAERAVRDAIEVASLNGTSYLYVRSSARTPAMAQLLTRTYVATARQWHREVYSSKVELTFVSEQLQRYESESAAAEQAYKEHRDHCGFYDLESQKKSLVAAVDEADGRIQESTIRLVEIDADLDFVGRELEATPRTIEKVVPPSIQVSPEYQAALDQLNQLNGERTGLDATYAEGSELFRRKAAQIDAEIDRVETRLKVLPEFIEYGTPTRETSPNPRFEELTVRRKELLHEKETRTKTLELWKTARATQEERLQAALRCEPVHGDMALGVERAKARTLELSGALERAQALALLDRQDDMDSLRIALDGELPREKAGPDRKRFLLLGVFGGLAVGLFLATLRFLVDQRLYDAEVVSRELGLEVLAVAPEAPAWRRAGSRARSMTRLRKEPAR